MLSTNNKTWMVLSKPFVKLSIKHKPIKKSNNYKFRFFKSKIKTSYKNICLNKSSK